MRIDDLRVHVLTRTWSGRFWQRLEVHRRRLTQSIKQIDAWTTMLMAAWLDACDYGYVKGPTCFDWRLCMGSINVRVRTCIYAPPCIYIFSPFAATSTAPLNLTELFDRSIQRRFVFFISVAVMLEFLNPKGKHKKT